MAKIRKMTIEEAREKVKRGYRSATPSIDEVFRGRSSRGELVRLPNGSYRIYKKKGGD